MNKEGFSNYCMYSQFQTSHRQTPPTCLRRQGPHLVTLHDLGLDGFSNFAAFWRHSANRGLVAKFSVLNISLPGQVRVRVRAPLALARGRS